MLGLDAWPLAPRVCADAAAHREVGREGGQLGRAKLIRVAPAGIGRLESKEAYDPTIASFSRRPAQPAKPHRGVQPVEESR